MSLLERFHAKIIPEPNSGCHLWTASVDSRGYGHIMDNKRLRRAHRLAWELARGPVPEGMYVCHKCDVKTCVNPDHLYLGTHQQNINDAFDRGLYPRRKGEANPAARLAEDEVRAIRAASGTHRAIAKRFGASPSQVWRIRHGESWADTEAAPC